MGGYADKPWLESYTLGPFKLKTHIDYPDKPLHSLINEAGDLFPNRDAYDYLGARMKFRELKLQVDRLACALRGLGVEKGDRVMTMLPTSPQFIMSDFAILKAGGCLVPCSTYLTAEGLEQQAASSGARIIICAEKYFPLIESIRRRTSLHDVIVTARSDYTGDEEAEPAKFDGGLSLRSLIRDAEDRPPEVEIDPKEDLAILAFTGGSTGVPKGVMLTHSQRLANVYQCLPWMMAPVPSLKGSASALIALPAYHAMGHLIVQSCISWGLRQFLLPDPRNVRMVAAIMNEHRPFLVFVVPTQLMQLANPRIELKRMPVLIMSGSAPLPAEVAVRIEEKIKMPVSEGYGLTETGPCTHLNISGFAKVTRFARDTKPGIGLPVPDTDVKIVDPDTDMEVPFGEVGEIWVRGPQVMKGYWPDPGLGLEDDGWLRTGDLGRMDHDGYFHLVDRIKDMINVSGLKVYSIEVDEALFKHPAVSGVVTIGVPVPEKPGVERVKAFVTLNEGFDRQTIEKELIAFARERLPAYAVPDLVEVLDDIPLTTTEKVFKRVLREREMEKQRGSG
ncbi:MAG: AMP-binding protein [Spirochaetales bacterium]|nr:AMP-binding protein [Spirochaetales bacterium]